MKNAKSWSFIAQNIRRARRSMGLSQHQLADRAGVSRGAVAAIEGNLQLRGMRLETLIRISDALGMPPWTMLLQDVPEQHAAA